MNREQTTICLPAELMERLRKDMRLEIWLFSSCGIIFHHLCRLVSHRFLNPIRHAFHIRARFTLRLPEALLDLIGKEAVKKVCPLTP